TRPSNVRVYQFHHPGGGRNGDYSATRFYSQQKIKSFCFVFFLQQSARCLSRRPPGVFFAKFKQKKNKLCNAAQ
ncbi:MAG TPA: hypothetical protein PKI71_14635, partial [Candidatus Rifleibacterium sp.]|nr:hypothetical protein [Candidatus Rifleibacterium sp.]